MTNVLSVSPTHSIPTVTSPAAQASQDLVAALQQHVQGEVRFDNSTRMLYSTDASLYQVMPVGVVIPKHLDDIQATVEIAARHRVPVLPRGSGSSLAGQAVGAAIIIDQLRNFRSRGSRRIASRTSGSFILVGEQPVTA